MLNPDGVYRGHYRLDSLGYDENRVYNRIVKFPKFNGPLAVLETCKNYNVAFYIDLHAHSVLSNSFVYTNWHPDPSIHQAILEFPKQLKSKVVHFRIKEAMSTQINYEKNQYEIEGIYTEKAENFQKAPDLKIHFTKENLVQSIQLQKNQLINTSTIPQSMNDDCPYSINPYLTGVAKSDVYLTTQVMFSYTLEVIDIAVIIYSQLPVLYSHHEYAYFFIFIFCQIFICMYYVVKQKLRLNNCFIKLLIKINQIDNNFQINQSLFSIQLKLLQDRAKRKCGKKC